MASKTPLFKVTKKVSPSGKVQYNWALQARNGEKVASGSGLDVKPRHAYKHLLAKLMEEAVIVETKPKRKKFTVN